VNVVDSDGVVMEEFEVLDSGDGLEDMCRRLNRARVRRVAIERSDGPVVDALLEGGFEVVVVASRSVKALRVRYGSAATSPTGPMPTCWPTVSHACPSPQGPC